MNCVLLMFPVMPPITRYLQNIKWYEIISCVIFYYFMIYDQGIAFQRREALVHTSVCFPPFSSRSMVCGGNGNMRVPHGVAMPFQKKTFMTVTIRARERAKLSIYVGSPATSKTNHLFYTKMTFIMFIP